MLPLAYCTIHVVIALKHSVLNQSAPGICHLQFLPFLGESEITPFQVPLTVH